MPFTAKQNEYFRNAHHRWNVKSGATRSGKTYMDLFLIPKRIRAVAGKDGLTVLLGNTKGTLQRNIIEPLQEIWGKELVSSIRSDNTAELFGEWCYCLGADKVTQVDRLRGSSIKYCYGDEVVTWHKDVFDMLKSRLDKSYSRFDGTCNPEGRHHWFKKFLDSKDVDLYLQQYTIDDNPFVPTEFVENLKREYSGTVFYDRYIKGLWVNAEGLIYKKFAADPDSFMLKSIEDKDIIFATIGVDFGGGSSAHAFCCVGFTRGLREVIVLHDYRRKDAADTDKLCKDLGDFLTECRLIAGGRFPITDMYCDSAEQVLIGSIKSKASAEKWKINIHNARKNEINDRIRFHCIIQGAGRFFLRRECEITSEALQEAMWDGSETKDVRLDDGTTNIDNLDAMEYAVEPYMKDIIAVRR